MTPTPSTRWIILGVSADGAIERPHPAVMSEFESYQDALDQAWFLNRIYHSDGRWRVFSTDMAALLESQQHIRTDGG